MTEHLADMGNNLKKAVLSYNKGVGSFETRVVVKAREFKELGIGETSKDLGDLEPIETVPRETQGNLLGD
jgi:DNA recombination protein RmuC